MSAPQSEQTDRFWQTSVSVRPIATFSAYRDLFEFYSQTRFFQVGVAELIGLLLMDYYCNSCYHVI